MLVRRRAARCGHFDAHVPRPRDCHHPQSHLLLPLQRAGQQVGLDGRVGRGPFGEQMKGHLSVSFHRQEGLLITNFVIPSRMTS